MSNTDPCNASIDVIVKGIEFQGEAAEEAKVGSVSGTTLTLDPHSQSSGNTYDLQGRVFTWAVLIDLGQFTRRVPFRLYIEEDTECSTVAKLWP